MSVVFFQKAFIKREVDVGQRPFLGALLLGTMSDGGWWQQQQQMCFLF